LRLSICRTPEKDKHGRKGEYGGELIFDEARHTFSTRYRHVQDAGQRPVVYGIRLSKCHARKVVAIRESCGLSGLPKMQCADQNEIK
jgi:hypothetical protein